MKPNPLLLIVAVLCSLLALSNSASAQGTAFTYQGQLNTGGSPANGSYDIAFSLYVTNEGDVAIAGPVTNSAVAVTNGLFTTMVDFGNVFTGASNWLAIAVSTNGANAFSTLAPRQPVTPTPYAIYAENANSLAGTLPASQLTSIGGGIYNFFVGPSGNATTYGSFNTADGVNALFNNTGGSHNTAVGDNALSSNTSGGHNTAVGDNALWSNTSGDYNTATGSAALNDNTSGFDNTANGVNALYLNTNGWYNTAAGFQALFSNTSGSNNIALGFNAGFNITTGSGNVDIGNPGLSGDTNIIRIGSGQTASYLAGTIYGNGGGLTGLNVSAAQLTSIGNTNGGTGNFFLGPSGNAGNSGSDNTANGNYALANNTSGSGNTANGLEALFSNTSGSDNTANGFEALVYNTSGSNNTANGSDALAYNTSGSDNTANGSYALFSNTSGSYNTANGYEALARNTSGSANTANGYGALEANTSGNGNTATGYGALTYNTSSGNTAYGADALQYNTSGSDNTANGEYALQYNTSGFDNTANGYGALQYNTSGFYNTANGNYALQLNTSGSNNIALGFEAGLFITNSYNIDIGNQGLSTDNNIIRIGTTQTAAYISGTVYANGVALTSDRNAKENFATLDAQTVLARVASLPLTEWNYKAEDTEVRHLGPMAQDFHAAFGLNGCDDQHISMVDESGVALAAIQGLNQKVEEENSELRSENAELKARLDKLEQLLNSKVNGGGR